MVYKNNQKSGSNKMEDSKFNLEQYAFFQVPSHYMYIQFNGHIIINTISYSLYIPIYV